MSGGVDSSVAAALLAEQGHDVIGLSMQLYPRLRAATQSFGSCCTLDDLHDARRVASRTEVPALHRELRAAVHRHGDLELRQRVHVRAHADSVRALQQRHEVLDAAGPRARARVGVSGDGTLRPRRAGRRRTIPPPPQYRSRQGPVVLPVLAHAGSTRPRRVPRRCAHQAGGAGRGASTRPAWSRTRQTARRSASCPMATTRHSSSHAPASVRSRRDRQSAGRAARDTCGRSSLHGGSAQGPRESRRRLRSTC